MLVKYCGKKERAEVRRINAKSKKAIYFELKFASEPEWFRSSPSGHPFNG